MFLNFKVYFIFHVTLNYYKKIGPGWKLKVFVCASVCMCALVMACTLFMRIDQTKMRLKYS